MSHQEEYAVFEVRIPISSTGPKNRESVVFRAYNEIINQLRIKRSWKVRIDRMEKINGNEPSPSNSETVIRSLAHALSVDPPEAGPKRDNDNPS